MIPFAGRWLARFPQLHLRLLRATGRGSIEKRVFLALLRRDDVICDIGANRGHFTRLFSDIAGPAGAVHAFEPVPATFARLRESVAGRANVTLHPCALGDAEGSVTLHLPGEDDGQASLRTHSSGSWQPGVDVRAHGCRMTTLDAWAAALPRLDFVKCDVEGAERLVLAGAGRALDRLSPLLFLEVNPEWTRAFGYTPDDLLADLRARGYDTFYAAADRITPLAAAWPPGSVNLLAAKARAHTARLRGLALV